MIWNRSDAYLGVFALTIESKPGPRKKYFKFYDAFCSLMNLTVVCKIPFLGEAERFSIFLCLPASSMGHGRGDWTLSQTKVCNFLSCFSYLFSYYFRSQYDNMIIHDVRDERKSNNNKTRHHQLHLISCNIILSGDEHYARSIFCCYECCVTLYYGGILWAQLLSGKLSFGFSSYEIVLVLWACLSSDETLIERLFGRPPGPGVSL